MIEFLIIGIVAFIMETIDSGLGMMYGTILSPLLILGGYNPFIVVPSILLSQAIGGVIATYQHHKFKNAEFNFKSKDFKIASLIFGLGFIAVVFGAFVGNLLPVIYLKTYIALLCIAMGSLVLIKKKFKFSWKKISLIGAISSFNKALSGGGFGPIVATGNITSGIETKRAIGIIDFAEAPICIVSFIAWFIIGGFIFPDANLIVPLCIGAGIGGLLGPYLLFRTKSKILLTKLIGALAIISGLYMVVKII